MVYECRDFEDECCLLGARAFVLLRASVSEIRPMTPPRLQRRDPSRGDDKALQIPRVITEELAASLRDEDRVAVPVAA